MGLECLQPRGRVRQRLGDPALVRLPYWLRASSGNRCRVLRGTHRPGESGIPLTGNVAARRRTAGLFVLVCRERRRDVVPLLSRGRLRRGGLCAQKRSEHCYGYCRDDRNCQARGHVPTSSGFSTSQASHSARSSLNSLPLITMLPLIIPIGRPFFAAVTSTLTSSPGLKVSLVQPLLDWVTGFHTSTTQFVTVPLASLTSSLTK